MDISGAKIRVMLRYKADGAECPIFATTEEEVTEIREFFAPIADVVESRRSSPAEFTMDFIKALANGTNVQNGRR